MIATAIINPVIRITLSRQYGSTYTLRSNNLYYNEKYLSGDNPWEQ